MTRWQKAFFTFCFLTFTGYGFSFAGKIPQIIQNPASEISTELVILGGDDAGLGAAWAAGELGIQTLLILSHPRDFGGDFTNFIPTDIAVSARTVGGVNYIYDTFARKHTNEKSGSSTAGKDGRVAPPGPSIEFLYDYMTRYPNVRILAGYLPKPHSGILDTKNQVKNLKLIAEDGKVVTVYCQYAIDGTPEGYGTKAFDLPVIFGREGQHKDEDPTRNMEAFAGRRLFSTLRNDEVEISGKVPLLEQYCDRRDEFEDNSMGASPVIPLKEYLPKGSPVPADAPWLFNKPPENFNPADFMHLIKEKRPGGNRNGRRIWRFSGREPLKSLPEWYRLPDGSHYLRHDDVWAMKRLVEKQAFSYVVRSMYYYQKYTPEGPRFGIDRDSFAAFDAPYHLSDFGTSTYGGDQAVACRLYHRVLARLKVPDPLGGQMFFRKEGRPFFHEKSYWLFDGIGVPLLEIDYHTILGKSVKSPPGASPEGSAFTYCVPEASGLNFHSLPRRCIEPDYFLIDNYLSPGSPGVTFMAQSSLRAGSSMNHLGVAAAAMVYLAKKNNIPVSQINTIELQWTLVNRLNTAIVYFENALAGTPGFPYEQMPGVLGIPRKNLTDQWQKPFLTHEDAADMFQQYARFKEKNPEQLLSFAKNDILLSRREFIHTLNKLTNTEKIVESLDFKDKPVHLNDIRQILTRDMVKNIADLPPYRFPDYVLFDSFNRCPDELGQPEVGDQWQNIGFEIYRGHAIAKNKEMTSTLLTQGTNDNYKLSVEMWLEQKPEDVQNSAIQQCGLLFDYQNNEHYGFFGIRTDKSKLEFEFQHNGIVKVKSVDYTIASFVLDVIKTNSMLEFRLNGEKLFQEKHNNNVSSVIGLIHGPGEGRVHFQNMSQIRITN